MSSTKAETRLAILAAARRLLEEPRLFRRGTGGHRQAAGVSRQAIYLHFGSKANLLLELARHVDESQGLPALIGQFRSAPTSLEAMDRLIHVLATYGPKVLRIALVMDGARQSDHDALAAWRDRMMSRLGGCDGSSSGSTATASSHRGGQSRTRRNGGGRSAPRRFRSC